MATTSPTATSTAPDLAFMLSQASHALATALTAALAEMGISPRAHCVLCRAQGGEFTQIQLAEMAGLDKTTMVVTLDELEKSGYAVRRPSPTDRRARIVEVTPAGQEITARAKETVDQIHRDLLAALPAEERSAFVSGLTRLVEGPLSNPVRCQPPVRRRAPRAP